MVLRKSNKKNNYLPAKTAAELAKMQQAGSIVAKTLNYLREIAQPGMSTLDLDQAAETKIRELGGIPSFKGYQGFSGSICASVNQAVVHGLPSQTKILKSGDLVTIDCGAIFDNWHGDAAITFGIGSELVEKLQILSAVTQTAMLAGIAKMQVGGFVSDISHAIEQSVFESEKKFGLKFGLIKEYGGHGIGTQMHMDPFVPNYGKPKKGKIITAGSTLCIEPMLTLGSDKLKLMPDKWTLVTEDNSCAAHWEHTVVATETGPKILTTID